MKYILTVLLLLIAFERPVRYREPIPKSAIKIDVFKQFIDHPVLIKGNYDLFAELLVPAVYLAIPPNTLTIPDNDLSVVICAIMISEGGKETADGTVALNSPLVKVLNNPFGIKGEGKVFTALEYYTGYVKTPQEFKRFSTVEESIVYLVKLFDSSKRYNKAKKSKDGRSFLLELQKAGYATSPDWFEKFTIPVYQKLTECQQHSNQLRHWRR